MPFVVAWREVYQELRQHGYITSKGGFDGGKVSVEMILKYRFWPHVTLICQHCERGESPFRCGINVYFLQCPDCDETPEDPYWTEAALGAFRLRGYWGLRALFGG